MSRSPRKGETVSHEEADFPGPILAVVRYVPLYGTAEQAIATACWSVRSSDSLANAEALSTSAAGPMTIFFRTFRPASFQSNS
jgi:hypothetical protein